MSSSGTIKPTILVIFGVTGDLSKRYSLPAILAIKKAGLLPQDFRVVGTSRRQVNTNEVLSSKLGKLEDSFEILQVNPDNLEDFTRLKRRILEIGGSYRRPPQIIFYPIVPPEAAFNIIQNLGGCGLNFPAVKLLLEKPFGSDLDSANKLAAETKKHFSEKQLYHIDHYLAKEVAQNISVFLGSNALFRAVWNNQFIEEIEILATERIGAGDRAEFYEQTGALRDLIQSHLLQLAALVLTEPSADVFNLERLPPRRLRALRAIEPIDGEQLNRAVAAQYGGYGASVGNPGSATETFAAVNIASKSPRWRGVKIRLITGKKLDEKLTEIRIHFKKSHDTQANLLSLRLQPREGIELELWVKQPGYERKLQKLSHEFTYEHHFGRLPDAYEQVLVDAMRGSHGLFATTAEVLASWKILQPLLEHWQAGHKNLRSYQAGASVEQVLVKAQKQG